MRTLSKLLTAVVVLALLAMPMAGLAESTTAAGGEQVTLSLENIIVGIGEGSPITMDFSGLKGEVTLGGDMASGRGLVAARLLANDAEVVSGVASLENGTLTAVLNGLNKAFQISEADLSALMGASAQDAAAMEQMGGLFGAFASYLSEDNMKALEEEAAAAMGDLSAMKGFTEAGEEEIELFGETVTAKKYDVNMTAEDFKALMDKSLEVVMNNEGYKNLIAEVNKLTGEEAQINDETMTKIIDAAYSDISITGTAWQVDEEHARMDLNYTITIDPAKVNEAMDVQAETEDLEPVTVSYNMKMDVAGNNVDGTMTMDMGEQGKADITFKNTESVTDASTANTFEMGMNMDVAGEAVQMTVNGDETVGQDGTYALNFGMSMMQDTQEMMSLGLNYNGVDGEADGVLTNEGTVSLSVSSMGQMFSISGDVFRATQALPEGTLLDVSGMEIVDPLTLTEEQAASLENELLVVLMSGLNDLMQVPALRDLLGPSLGITTDTVDDTTAQVEPVAEATAEAEAEPAAEAEAEPTVEAAAAD